MVLTLFSVPKPFEGYIGVIQKNAIQSWVHLHPSSEIILLGDEEGTAEAAAEYGVRHVSGLRRNRYGTPLLDSVFKHAQGAGRYSLMCFINADIILMSDFIEAIRQMQVLKRSFLMVGRRWDVELGKPLDFGSPGWKEELGAYVRQHGRPRPPSWIDYFVFPRGLYKDIPPFAIGRPALDNWLLWKAHSLGSPIVDASEVVLAVHQNHDYSHYPGGQKGVWEGLEAQENRKLMGGWHRCFTLSDVTHKLTASSLKRNLNPDRFVRMFWTRRWHWLMALTQSLRRRLGLARTSNGLNVV
jgi:hypothetical protein